MGMFFVSPKEEFPILMLRVSKNCSPKYSIKISTVKGLGHNEFEIGSSDKF